MKNYIISEQIFDAFTQPLQDPESTIEELQNNTLQIYDAIESKLKFKSVKYGSYFTQQLKARINSDFSLNTNTDSQVHLKLANKKLINICILIENWFYATNSVKPYGLMPQVDKNSSIKLSTQEEHQKHLDNFLNTIWDFEQNNADENDTQSHHLILTHVEEFHFYEIEPNYNLDQRFQFSLRNLKKIYLLQK